MWLVRKIYGLVQPLYAWARSRRWVIKWLFDVRLPKGTIVHWDSTTVQLKDSIRRTARPGERILEMGTGAGALLSIWASQNMSPAVVEGVDISVARIESAKRVVAFNQAGIRVWASDLFESVEGKYDMIFFNPPYVPTREGRELKLTKRVAADGDQVWDGGVDGTEVIGRFLQSAPPHLLPEGRILIGVQRFYVNLHQMEEIAKRYGYILEEIHHSPPNPSDTYVLKVKTL